MEFPRELYLQKLIGKMHNGRVKIITGIRRCGKSYLLFHLLPAICTSRESQIIRSLGFHWKICQMPDIVIRWSWINTCGVELWISHVNTM